MSALQLIERMIPTSSFVGMGGNIVYPKGMAPKTRYEF